MRATLAVVSMFAVIGSASSGAEPIHMVCDGKLWATESEVFAQPETNRSIIIDIENGRVGGSLGEFSITRSTDAEVFFGREFVTDDGTRWLYTGTVDRISGAAGLAGSKNGGESYVIIHQLVCRPAKPLF